MEIVRPVHRCHGHAGVGDVLVRSLHRLAAVEHIPGPRESKLTARQTIIHGENNLQSGQPIRSETGPPEMPLGPEILQEKGP